MNLGASCWNSSFAYGQNYTCTVTVSSSAGAVTGAIYSLDSAAPLSVPLSNGNAGFTLATPAAGNHTVNIQYPQQGTFAATQAGNQRFNVTLAPVNENVTASTYYSLQGAALTISASLSSWSAGTPSQGLVGFCDSGALLATVPVTNGTASYSTSGQHFITATYSGGSQFAPATGSLTLIIAK